MTPQILDVPCLALLLRICFLRSLTCGKGLIAHHGGSIRLLLHSNLFITVVIFTFNVEIFVCTLWNYAQIVSCNRLCLFFPIHFLSVLLRNGDERTGNAKKISIDICLVYLFQTLEHP